MIRLPRTLPFGRILAFALLVAARPAAAQLTLDPNFDDQLVVGSLSAPVAMAFVPGSTAGHERILFIEQKTVRVRLIVDGVLSATDPVGTIPNVVTSGNEQGILSLALDPRWPEKPYAYLHYNSSLGGIRLSRFRLAGDLGFTGNGALTLDPASRYDILTGIPDASPNHNGGCLRFAPDGMLLFSTGEDFQYCPALDTTSTLGKLFRLNVKDLPDTNGGPPPLASLAPGDNPWAGSANAVRALEYAIGFRNPFRFHIDPADGMVYLGDVGNVTWEEVDRVPPGANCGWPVYEGFVLSSSCPTGVPSPHNAPLVAYDHSALGGRSVMLLSVYRSPGPTAPYAFPPEYEGTVFYSDYYTGLFRGLRFDGTSWQPVTTPGLDPNWATGALYVCDGAIGPDGSLYYVRQSINFGPLTGQIRKIRWTGAVDVPATGAGPVTFALASRNPALGSASLRYVLASATSVSVAITDAGGRHVRTLVSGREPAGAHEAHWNGRDASGAPVPAGVYFATLRADGRTRVQRIALVR